MNMCATIVHGRSALIALLGGIALAVRGANKSDLNRNRLSQNGNGRCFNLYGQISPGLHRSGFRFYGRGVEGHGHVHAHHGWPFTATWFLCLGPGCFRFVPSAQSDLSGGGMGCVRHDMRSSILCLNKLTREQDRVGDNCICVYDALGAKSSNSSHTTLL